MHPNSATNHIPIDNVSLGVIVEVEFAVVDVVEESLGVINLSMSYVLIKLFIVITSPHKADEP